MNSRVTSRKVSKTVDICIRNEHDKNKKINNQTICFQMSCLFPVSFLKTTFETLAVDSFKVFQNQTLSRVIESFLEYADFEILNTVLQIFGKNWDSSVTDRFAHRVLQKTLEVYQTCLNNSSELVERDEAPEFMTEVVTKISEFGVHMYENYPNYMEHSAASYILRAYLKVLAGIRVKTVGTKEGKWM